MKVWVLLVLLMALALPAFAAKGAGDVHRGNDLYRRGKYQEAMAHYEQAVQKNPTDARISYDLGAAAYKAGDFDKAVEYFQKSLLTDDEKFKQDVHYNLGDAFYRLGVSQEDKEIDQSIKKLQESLGSFEKVLAVDPRDQDAIHNYDFVKKEMERLKLKKQEQKMQQQQKQQASSQPKKDQNKEQGSDKGNDQKQPDASQEQGSGHDKDQGKDKDKGQAKDQEKGKDVLKDNEKNKPQAEQPQEKNGASGQEHEQQISSQQEANDVVDDFERNELPKGLLNLNNQVRKQRPVEKDW